MNQQFDSKTIETLKAARNQVVQAPLEVRQCSLNHSSKESEAASPCVLENPKSKDGLLTGQADNRNEDGNVNPVRDKTPEASAQPSAGISNGVNRGQGLNSTPVQFTARNKFAPLEARTKSAADTAGVLPLTGFAEEFVQKLASIEREKAAVDEEMAKVEKLWSGLVEKKKQLEARRNELIKVKDKITTLNKEMDDVLSS